jgi:hypothetical protein
MVLPVKQALPSVSIQMALPNKSSVWMEEQYPVDLNRKSCIIYPRSEGITLHSLIKSKVIIMRKIDLLRISFKAAQEAGTLSDPKMTFKAYQVEQVGDALADKSADTFFDMEASIALLENELEEPVILPLMVMEQLPEYIPQSPEAELMILEAQKLLGFVDDTLDVIDSTAVLLQDEVRTHIPDVSTTPLKKSNIARNIFNREQDDAYDEERPMVRKTVIQLFMSVAGLSPAGAATYYQNIKREKGLIGS